VNYQVICWKFCSYNDISWTLINFLIKIKGFSAPKINIPGSISKRCKILWKKILIVTTDGSPTSSGKILGFIKTMQEHFLMSNHYWTTLFFVSRYSAKHLNIKHVPSTVMKFCILRARGLSSKQLIYVLQDLDKEYGHLPFHSSILWLDLGKVIARLKQK
jgi:hypothetical protein